MKNRLLTIFWTLILFFTVIMAEVFCPVFKDIAGNYIPFLAPFIVFSLLGLILLVITLKDKTEEPLRKFLLLTGGSAFSVTLFVILHNLFYALMETTKDIMVLPLLLEFLHAGSFIIALIVAPLVFLIGFFGVIYSLIKK